MRDSDGASGEYIRLCERADRRLRGLPDRGNGKYADLQTIFADPEHAAKANSIIDEAVNRKIVREMAAEDIKMLKTNCCDEFAMDPADFDMLVRVRATNDHTAQAEKLARALRAVTFSMDGGEYGPADGGTPPLRAVGD